MAQHFRPSIKATPCSGCERDRRPLVESPFHLRPARPVRAIPCCTERRPPPPAFPASPDEPQACARPDAPGEASEARHADARRSNWTIALRTLGYVAAEQQGVRVAASWSASDPRRRRSTLRWHRLRRSSSSSGRCLRSRLMNLPYRNCACGQGERPASPAISGLRASVPRSRCQLPPSQRAPIADVRDGVRPAMQLRRGLQASAQTVLAHMPCASAGNARSGSISFRM